MVCEKLYSANWKLCHYKKLAGENVKFPKLNGPISMEDFGRIEKATDAELWLYQIGVKFKDNKYTYH